jgi:hypothetical protein
MLTLPPLPSHCQVLEETGYIPTDHGLEVLEENRLSWTKKMVGSTVKKLVMFIVAGVDEDYKFVTQAQKEVRQIQWFNVGDLKTVPRQVYDVKCFIAPLKRWIADKRKQQGAAGLAGGAARGRAGSGAGAGAGRAVREGQGKGGGADSSGIAGKKTGNAWGSAGAKKSPQLAGGAQQQPPPRPSAWGSAGAKQSQSPPLTGGSEGAPSPLFLPQAVAAVGGGDLQLRGGNSSKSAWARGASQAGPPEVDMGGAAWSSVGGRKCDKKASPAGSGPSKGGRGREWNGWDPAGGGKAGGRANGNGKTRTGGSPNVGPAVAAPAPWAPGEAGVAPPPVVISAPPPPPAEDDDGWSPVQKREKKKSPAGQGGQQQQQQQRPRSSSNGNSSKGRGKPRSNSFSK